MGDYPIEDVNLLLASKEMAFRDLPKGREEGDAASGRLLELQIMDVRGHLDTRLAALGVRRPGSMVSMRAAASRAQEGGRGERGGSEEWRDRGR